jgi:hypothetical protein
MILGLAVEESDVAAWIRIALVSRYFFRRTIDKVWRLAEEDQLESLVDMLENSTDERYRLYSGMIQTMDLTEPHFFDPSHLGQQLPVDLASPHFIMLNTLNLDVEIGTVPGLKAFFVPTLENLSLVINPVQMSELFDLITLHRLDLISLRIDSSRPYSNTLHSTESPQIAACLSGMQRLKHLTTYATLLDQPSLSALGSLPSLSKLYFLDYWKPNHHPATRVAINELAKDTSPLATLHSDFSLPNGALFSSTTSLRIMGSSSSNQIFIDSLRGEKLTKLVVHLVLISSQTRALQIPLRFRSLRDLQISYRPQLHSVQLSFEDLRSIGLLPSLRMLHLSTPLCSRLHNVELWNLAYNWKRLKCLKIIHTVYRPQDSPHLTFDVLPRLLALCPRLENLEISFSHRILNNKCTRQVSALQKLHLGRSFMHLQHDVTVEVRRDIVSYLHDVLPKDFSLIIASPATVYTLNGIDLKAVSTSQTEILESINRDHHFRMPRPTPIAIS